MIKRVVFLLIILFISTQAQTAKTEKSELEVKADLLRKYYNKSVKYPDSVEIKIKFFNAFPDNFDELTALYGYDYEEGPGILYSVGNAHMNNLFRNLAAIVPKRDYYRKLIKIGTGGKRAGYKITLSAVTLIKSFIQNEFFENPALAADVLEEFSDTEIESFFFFFFDAPHPVWKSIPKELMPIKKINPRVFMLMKSGLEKALKYIKKNGH